MQARHIPYQFVVFHKPRTTLFPSQMAKPMLIFSLPRFSFFKKIFLEHKGFVEYLACYASIFEGPTKHRKGLKHRKGATKDLLNTVKYDNGPDNPKPNPNLILTLI